jgi:hypothetical protein
MATCPACGKVFSVYRARTTGPGSQSNHLHGHLQQIAEHTGFSMSELKDVLKQDLPGWPVVERLGHMVHVSEADVDTMVESAAIEWTHVKAAELGVVLREA